MRNGALRTAFSRLCTELGLRRVFAITVGFDFDEPGTLFVTARVAAEDNEGLVKFVEGEIATIAKSMRLVEEEEDDLK